MLTALLRKSAAADSRRPAIVLGRRRVSYGELETMAARCAGGLARRGIGSGDCVAVALPNGPEFVASLFACARLRAVMLPLSPWESHHEAARLAGDARARIVVTTPRRAAGFAGFGSRVDFDELLDSPEFMPAETDFRGPVLFLYTSGSTAERKRLSFTQENLCYEALNFTETVGLTSADNILCTIPLQHSYGLGNGLLDAVHAGSTLVIAEAGDGTPFAGRCPQLFDLIRSEKVRIFPGVPYQFQVLADLPEASSPPLDGLRICLSSGDVLPRKTYDGFFRRYGIPIRSLYGSTEAGSIAMDTDPAERLRFGSLGHPLRNVQIRIRSDDAGESVRRRGGPYLGEKPGNAVEWLR